MDSHPHQVEASQLLSVFQIGVCVVIRCMFETIETSITSEIDWRI
jgi:hypothetical protein